MGYEEVYEQKEDDEILLPTNPLGKSLRSGKMRGFRSYNLNSKDRNTTQACLIETLDPFDSDIIVDDKGTVYTRGYATPKNPNSSAYFVREKNSKCIFLVYKENTNKFWISLYQIYRMLFNDNIPETNYFLAIKSNHNKFKTMNRKEKYYILMNFLDKYGEANWSKEK